MKRRLDNQLETSLSLHRRRPAPNLFYSQATSFFQPGDQLRDWAQTIGIRQKILQFRQRLIRMRFSEYVLIGFYAILSGYLVTYVSVLMRLLGLPILIFV